MGPRRRPILRVGCCRERPLTVMLTVDPDGWSRGTVPETVLFARSRTSQGAAGNFSMSSTKSSGDFRRGLRSKNSTSDWKMSTFA